VTEMLQLPGTSLQREGNPPMTTTTPTAKRLLPDLSDDELVTKTRAAWLDALTSNSFWEIRACQAEALRRGKVHLYDQGYVQFWLHLCAPADLTA